jgi:hypothetical protein
MLFARSFFWSFVFFKLALSEYYQSTSYYLVEDYQAGTSNFFNNFNFYTGADPSDGFVEYYPVKHVLS